MNIVIHVDNKKYTFIHKTGDYRIHILRYGDPWLVLEKGSNAIFSLMAEFEELRSQCRNDTPKKISSRP